MSASERECGQTNSGRCLEPSPNISLTNDSESRLAWRVCAKVTSEEQEYRRTIFRGSGLSPSTLRTGFPSLLKIKTGVSSCAPAHRRP